MVLSVDVIETFLSILVSNGGKNGHWRLDIFKQVIKWITFDILEL